MIFTTRFQQQSRCLSCHFFSSQIGLDLCCQEKTDLELSQERLTALNASLDECAQRDAMILTDLRSENARLIQTSFSKDQTISMFEKELEELKKVAKHAEHQVVELTSEVYIFSAKSISVN